VTKNRQTFEEWKQEVNDILLHRLGIDADDLPDYPYRRDYEDGATPRQVAARTVKAAKREFGM
jgi:hypothetical protein